MPQLNVASPTAHLWVPSETEQCQAGCAIARMWATLFWSLQFASAVAALYLHFRREEGLALFQIATKLVVGALLLKAYVEGVLRAPIGLGGPACEWVFAALYANAIRRGRA